MNYRDRQMYYLEALVHVTFCFLVTNRYKSDVHDWASVDDLWPGSALWTHRCWWYGDRCLCWSDGASCYEQRYIDVPKSYSVCLWCLFSRPQCCGLHLSEVRLFPGTLCVLALRTHSFIHQSASCHAESWQWTILTYHCAETELVV